MAPMKLKSEQSNQAYVMTYDDLTNEINEQYESFKKSTKKKVKLLLLNRESNGGGGGRNGTGSRTGRNSRNGSGRGGCGGDRCTDPLKRNCYYCGQTVHTKNDCQMFKKERDKLFCEHYDGNRYDVYTCFKLKPKLKELKDSVKKLNKFGKGEHAGAAVGEGNKNDNADVELNLACIQWEDAQQ